MGGKTEESQNNPVKEPYKQLFAYIVGAYAESRSDMEDAVKAGYARLMTKLTFDLIATFNSFNKSTSRLSLILILLTVALVVLTIVLVGFGYVQVKQLLKS